MVNFNQIIYRLISTGLARPAPTPPTWRNINISHLGRRNAIDNTKAAPEPGYKVIHGSDTRFSHTLGRYMQYETSWQGQVGGWGT
jgi:hypothetical protein